MADAGMDIAKGVETQKIMAKHGTAYKKYRREKQMEGEVALGPVEWNNQRKKVAGKKKKPKKEEAKAPGPMTSILQPGSKGMLRG